jgi:hypothetical protein
MHLMPVAVCLLFETLPSCCSAFMWEHYVSHVCYTYTRCVLCLTSPSLLPSHSACSVVLTMVCLCGLECLPAWEVGATALPCS